MNDVWNSTPAWGYPYIASELTPSPAAHTLIEGGLAQQVLGLNPFIFWNRLIYLEAGGYRTLGPWSLSALGIPSSGTSATSSGGAVLGELRGRAGLEGNNTWEFGSFGMTSPVVPQRMTGSGTDRLTDVGFDTQYQFLGARDSFSVQARYIDENQNLVGESGAGPFPPTATTVCAVTT